MGSNNLRRVGNVTLICSLGCFVAAFSSYVNYGQIEFLLIVAAHALLYIGYLATVVGDYRTGVRFDWVRFLFCLLYWLILVILVTIVQAAH